MQGWNRKDRTVKGKKAARAAISERLERVKAMARGVTETDRSDRSTNATMKNDLAPQVRIKRAASWAENVKEEIMAEKNKTGKRELIDTGRDKRFVRRDEKGQFKESDDVGKSLSQDVRHHAKTKVKPGYGDKGDQ